MTTTNKSSTQAILEALNLHGNISAAARVLGMNKDTLTRRVKGNPILQAVCKPKAREPEKAFKFKY